MLPLQVIALKMTTDFLVRGYLAAQIETHAGFQNQFYEYSVAFMTQILNYPS